MLQPHMHEGGYGVKGVWRRVMVAVCSVGERAGWGLCERE